MQLIQEYDSDWSFTDPSITPDIQGMFYEAMDALEMGDKRTATRLTRKVVRECPNHIDAWHHLSIWAYAKGDNITAYAFCQAAVGIGLHAIPPEFRWDRASLPWGDLDNRPFMRAYHFLALLRMDQRDWTEAITILSRLLQVNPNDNLGCRYLLPDCWFESEQFDAIVDHCQVYSEDTDPSITYSNALAQVLVRGISEARAAMEEAVSDKPLVAKELLADSHPRPEGDLPGYITLDSPEEAWSYWDSHGKFWDRCEPAMALLKEVAETQKLLD